MKNLLLSLVGVAFLVTSACTQKVDLEYGQTKTSVTEVTLANTRLHLLSSKNVEQVYRIEVALPPSYADSSKSFSVLYVLDADKSFGMARDIVGWLSWIGEIPQLIVVGISYGGTTSDWWQKRSRDYTPTKDRSRIWGEWPLAGGADNFKAFMKDELFPLIETTYRTQSRDRSIVGLSFGGLFATYVLFSEPSLFSRYIIIAPALKWDNSRILEYEQKYHSQKAVLEAIVFTAIAELDEPSINEPWHDFNQILHQRNYQSLSWKEQVFPGETHISVFPGALSRGLKVVFAKGNSVA